MNARARDLIGRTIVAVDFGRAWDARRKEWYHEPRITLDNGRALYFSTEETEAGIYGTRIGITSRVRKARGVL